MHREINAIYSRDPLCIQDQFLIRVRIPLITPSIVLRAKHKDVSLSDLSGNYFYANVLFLSCAISRGVGEQGENDDRF